MMNENEHGRRVHRQPRLEKELERASSGVKSKFHSSKAALREVGV